MLVSIAEHCRGLPSIAEDCRALPSIARNQGRNIIGSVSCIFIYYINARNQVSRRIVNIYPIIKTYLFKQGGSPAPPRGSSAREARFSKVDDTELKQLVHRYETKDWVMIAHIMITKRSSRQCLDRWNFYLAPDIDHDLWTAWTAVDRRGPPWTAVDRRGPPWTATDEELLLERQVQIGSK
jgi:hypothetical protein